LPDTALDSGAWPRTAVGSGGDGSPQQGGRGSRPNQKQVKGELGWADFQVPLDRGDPPTLGAGLLRVSFFWQELLAKQPAQPATSNSQAAPAARQELLDDSDELAFGVPFAEISQCLGHLMQPIATVDDCRDLSCLAEPNQRRQPLRT
jgi:hypothetical protein